MVDDDDWWKKAERRAVRDIAAQRRKARLRRAARWLPHAGLTVLVVVAVAVAVHRADFSGLSWPVVDTAAEQPEDSAPARLLPEDLSGDPWTGTPAATYASDSDGIVVPAAAPVGKHSKEDVRKAYDATRRLLILSRLDTRVLTGRSVAPFLAGLAKSQRVRLSASPNELKVYTSRLAPGQHLLAPPRVKGTMTAQLGPDGVLTVVTKYVFVYALRPSLPVDERSDTHVIVRTDATYAFYGKPYAPADRGAWPLQAHQYWYNISCDAAAEGLIALPKLVDATDARGVDLPGADDTPYRLDSPMPGRDDCTRTPPSPLPSASGAKG